MVRAYTHDTNIIGQTEAIKHTFPFLDEEGDEEYIINSSAEAVRVSDEIEEANPVTISYPGGRESTYTFFSNVVSLFFTYLQ